MPSIHPLWISLLVFVCLCGFCAAFGAGNLPNYAFLEGKAVRHGDIEDILSELLIRGVEVSSGVIGFAKKSAGKKFSGLNIKRTRDYSQALDVGAFSTGLDSATLRVLVWILGYMSFGYATGEFEVTEEKLGVYRPEEHIDNPRGYANNTDARRYHPRLRGPVDVRELMVDPPTGIKNYMANEQGGWMTSTRYIRESLLTAIQLGRFGASEEDRYEALRLLGQALHTLEDLPAHSNWIELALIELGYTQVFPHVGINAKVSVAGTSKRVWPLVTGTFGGADFIQSLLGEATDHINENSLTDLNTAITDAQRENVQQLFERLGLLLKTVPLEQADLIAFQQSSQTLASQGSTFHLQGTPGGGPATTANEIPTIIYPFLALRDKIMKAVISSLNKIPGLRDSLDDIEDTMDDIVLSTIQPFILPIIGLVSEKMRMGNAFVMGDAAQYDVWNDPNSSDPTHSMLSKDHFSCYLNEPAGEVAKVIVRYAVTQVVAAWSNENINPSLVVDSILQCFFHPGLLNPSSQVQQEMLLVVRTWVEQLPLDKKARILECLTSDGVRQGRHRDEEKTTLTNQQINLQVQTQSTSTRDVRLAPPVQNVPVVNQSSSRDIESSRSYNVSASASLNVGGWRAQDSLDFEAPSLYGYTQNYLLALKYAGAAFQAYDVVPQRSDAVGSTYDRDIVTQQSSNVTQQSSIVTQQSQVVTQQSTVVAQQSSLVTQQSDMVAQQSGLVVQQSDQVATTEYGREMEGRYSQVDSLGPIPSTKLWPYNTDFYLQFGSETQALVPNSVPYQQIAPYGEQSSTTTYQATYNKWSTYSAQEQTGQTLGPNVDVSAPLQNAIQNMNLGDLGEAIVSGANQAYFNA